MIGGLFKTTSLAALAATAFVFSGAVAPASAADLGGNCCADLEERIAELEATTVRKGNRKVSVTLSGFVAHTSCGGTTAAVSDMYIGDGGNYGSRFRFVGAAKISPTVTAGFLYEFGVSQQRHQLDEPGATAAMIWVASAAPASLRDSTVWLRHSQLGMVKVGHGSTATDNLVLIDLGGMAAPARRMSRCTTAASSCRERRSFDDRHRQRRTDLGACACVATSLGTRAAATTSCTRRRRLHGFTVQTAVAEDNYWDVALRYAGEHHGFRLAFGIGYQEDSEFNASSSRRLRGISRPQLAT